MIEIIFEIIIEIASYLIALISPWLLIGIVISFVITFIIIPSFFNGDFSFYLFVGLSIFFFIITSSIDNKFKKKDTKT
jgi:hypothetical protein